jgi:hypothetical protein
MLAAARLILFCTVLHNVSGFSLAPSNLRADAYPGVNTIRMSGERLRPIKNAVISNANEIEQGP